jgi:peptidoglycan/LPS O-acetylase OafA/YrhL
MDVKRIDAIDGLRGVAALTVAIFHYQDWFFGSRPIPWGGDIPVQLFFILSGYILSAKYQDDLRSGAISAWEFFVQRVSRLWPLHMFALGVLFFAEWVLWHYYHGVHVLGAADTTSAFWFNVFLVHDWFGYPPGANFNTPSWSISSELAINLLWMAALLGGLWGWRLAWLTVIASVMALITVSPLTFNYNIFSNVLGTTFGVWRTALGFSLGCMIYWIEQQRHAAMPAWLSVVILLVTMVCLVTYNEIRAYGVDWLLGVVLLPAITMLAIEPKTLLARTMRLWPFRWLGRISYGVYLLHAPMASMVVVVFYWGIPLPGLWALGLIWLASVLLLSTATLFLVEFTGMRIMRRLVRRARS